jgi:hypothetical protein
VHLRQTLSDIGSYGVALVIVGAAAVCGSLLAYKGFDPARAYILGTPGQVEVSACQWVDESKAEGWDCRGSFEGQDLHIEDVQVRYLLDVEPDEPVDTVVSGADATVAWTPGLNLLGPGAAGIFVLGITPTFLLFYWWRDRRDHAAERAR